MDALSILDHVTAAWRVVGSVPMMVALVLLAAILAAVGGLVSWKMRVFGAMVGGGDEVRRPLDRDLQLLDLAEIAREAAAGLAGGSDHHVHQG